ncbi:nucleotide-binding protein [Kitasatospora sp. NPDC004272]
MPKKKLLLPPEGRRIGVFGKGGTGKTTTLGHLLAHWSDKGIPVAASDQDVPGDGEVGSLLTWARLQNLGGLVHPAIKHDQLREESRKHTPPGGIFAIDTDAWRRIAGGPHFTALASVDLAVLFMKPTNMELERGGSIFEAVDHLKAVGAPNVPRLVVVLSMVNRSAKSHSQTRASLVNEDLHVLETMIPLSDAEDGYAQSFPGPIRLVDGSPMDDLATELLEEMIK